MKKTTLYLPDDLKLAVERLAASTNRPEAEVIREAITLLTRSAGRPRPRGALFTSGDPHLSANVDEALQGFGER